MTGHSPVGFSSAERYWPDHCPGSVALIAALPPDALPADPEYTRAGTAAHAAAAWCLRGDHDAWEAAGRDWEGYSLAAEDLEAIQFYLDDARDLMGTAALAIVPHDLFIEEEFRAPEIHELAYGTIDLGFVVEWSYAVLTDYKHGEGQFVAVEWNKQLMGYAALVAVRYPTVQRFRLRVVQPRYEGEEKVREWEIDRVTLMDWVERELKPAMNRAAEPLLKPESRHAVPLKAGPWCRFCPVQKALACPEHKQVAEVVEDISPLVEKTPELISDARLGELYAKAHVLKMMIKSIEAETERRRLNGIDVPGTKTVKKKADRVFKETAEANLKAVLGPQVMTEPRLRSPAEIEKMGSRAKQLVKEFAFTPDTGYTVALLSDRRKAVTVQKPSEKFAKYIDKQEEIS